MRILLIVLSLLGLADSTFLVWDSLSVGESCGALLAKVGISTCTAVTESIYGVWLGYPISLFGMMAYGSLLALTVLGFRNENYRKGIFMIAFVGFIASLYLTYLQWQVLKSWCFFCLLSAFLMTFIFLTSIAFLGSVSKYVRRQRYDFKQSFNIFMVVTIVILVVFESVRGRMLYHAGSDLALGQSDTAFLAEERFMGVIDEEFITLGQINALAGAIEPTYRVAAFDFILLQKEAVLADTTLADMITNQTTLRLFPPNDNVTANPQASTDIDSGTGAVLGAAETPNLNAAGTNTSDDVEEDVTLGVEFASPVLTNVTNVTDVWINAAPSGANSASGAEVQFRAYVAFLERAKTKNKLELWELYLAELRDKHQVQMALP